MANSLLSTDRQAPAMVEALFLAGLFVFDTEVWAVTIE